MLTFDSRTGLPPLSPLIVVTEGAVRLTRFVLVFLCSALSLSTILFVVDAPTYFGSVDAGLLVLFAAFLLLNMIYLVAYWTLRPENVFGPAYLKYWARPMRFFVRATRLHQLKSGGRHARMAQRGSKKRH